MIAAVHAQDALKRFHKSGRQARKFDILDRALGEIARDDSCSMAQREVAQVGLDYLHSRGPCHWWRGPDPRVLEGAAAVAEQLAFQTVQGGPVAAVLRAVRSALHPVEPVPQRPPEDCQFQLAWLNKLEKEPGLSPSQRQLLAQVVPLLPLKGDPQMASSFALASSLRETILDQPADQSTLRLLCHALPQAQRWGCQDDFMPPLIQVLASQCDASPGGQALSQVASTVHQASDWRRQERGLKALMLNVEDVFEPILQHPHEPGRSLAESCHSASGPEWDALALEVLVSHPDIDPAQALAARLVQRAGRTLGPEQVADFQHKAVDALSRLSPATPRGEVLNLIEGILPLGSRTMDLIAAEDERDRILQDPTTSASERAEAESHYQEELRRFTGVAPLAGATTVLQVGEHTVTVNGLALPPIKKRH